MIVNDKQHGPVKKAGYMLAFFVARCLARKLSVIDIKATCQNK
jgi:hypothetical protein